MKWRLTFIALWKNRTWTKEIITLTGLPNESAEHLEAAGVQALVALLRHSGRGLYLIEGPIEITQVET